MNIENLRACVQYFEEEPLRLEMGNWINKRHQIPEISYTLKNPSCGTVACLCGSAMILEAQRLNLINPRSALKSWESYETFGMRYFDISNGQAKSLFYFENWSEPFQSFYRSLAYDFSRYSNPELFTYIKKQMVMVLRERVEFFIRENNELTTI